MTASKKATSIKFRTVILRVKNLKRSLRFYRDALGIPFEPAPDGRLPFAARIGGVLLLLDDFEKPPKRGKRPTLIDFHFRVTDVDSVYRRLKRKRVRLEESPSSWAWDRELTVFDPDGYGIVINGPLPQKRKKKRRTS